MSWSYLCASVSSLLEQSTDWSARMLADPATPAAVAWVLGLAWWQTVLGIGTIFAILFGTKRVVRWPFLLFIVTFLTCELIIYFSVRYVVFVLERFVFLTKSARAVRPLRKAMKKTASYAEWSHMAADADEQLGATPWKSQPHSRYYNYPLLQSLMTELRTSRAENDVSRLTIALQTCLHKNFAGIMNENLYSKSMVGTKYVIDEYINEVLKALKYLQERAVGAAATERGAPIGSSADAADATMNGAEQSASRVSRAKGRNKGKAGGARSRSSSRQGRSGSKKKAQLEELEHAAAAAASLNGHPSSPSNGHAAAAAAASNPPPFFSTAALDATYMAPGLDIADSSSPLELLRFFQSAKRQFGATALCLSGGASLGNYSWGVVRALLDEGLLPRVLSGTSSGAVVAALVGSRTDEELRQVLNARTLADNLNSFEESWFTCAWRFIKHRVMYSNETWLSKLQFFANTAAIPRMTFLEAHARTGRVLSITCTSQRKHNPSLLLNYLTTPHVCIDSAILASAAVPGFIHPVVLMEKHPQTGVIRPYHDKDLQWCDGSLQRDLPLSELAEQFGVNFFLVSQTNPHIIPWFFNSRGQSGTPSWAWRRRTGGYRGGFLLSALELWLKEDMKKNLRVLNALDLVPAILGSDFSFLFLQDFQGQVTMVPNASLRDFAKIISDPTEADLERFLREGRLMTWRKFSMIRNRMKVGHALNEAITKLVETMQQPTQHIQQQPQPHTPQRRNQPVSSVSPALGWHGEEEPPMLGLHPIARSRNLAQDRTLGGLW